MCNLRANGVSRPTSRSTLFHYLFHIYIKKKLTNKRNLVRYLPRHIIMFNLIIQSIIISRFNRLLGGPPIQSFIHSLFRTTNDATIIVLFASLSPGSVYINSKPYRNPIMYRQKHQFVTH